MLTRFLSLALVPFLLPALIWANPPARVVVQQQANHCYAAAPVHAATTYHAPTYYPPAYVPVHISPDYYYSTYSGYAAKLQAEATAAETVKLLADAIRLGQAFAPQQHAAQQQLAPQPLIQAPPATPQARGTPVNPAFANLVAARCLKCHTGKDAKGGVDLSELSTVPKGIRRKATSLACLGEMPPQPPELTADEVALFKSWLKAAE